MLTKRNERNKEIVHCEYCDRVVGKIHWVSSKEGPTGVFTTVYWCSLCQRDFSVVWAKEPTYSWTCDGYILIKVPGIGTLREHTYVWEQAHGRLEPGFVIHHIDGDKTNNKLENLIAIPKKNHSRSLAAVNRKLGL